MRRNVLAWAAGIVLLPLVGAGTAMADTTQSVGQSAGNLQVAESEAASMQVKPTNTNISVRVLSAGNDGDVTQSNTSSAAATAGNANSTVQAALQAAGGGGGGAQEIAQKALSAQGAGAAAVSKQLAPTNTNVAVRVLSAGDNGDVTQSNASEATADAGNANATKQAAAQEQAGGAPAPAPLEARKVSSPCDTGCRPEPCASKCDHGSSGPAVQSIGQAAKSFQEAGSEAGSLQAGAKNVNAPVHIGGGESKCGCGYEKAVPSGGGDVGQSNTSSADSTAGNRNWTGQKAAQLGGGHSPVAVQAIGQLAGSEQAAFSKGLSLQMHPSNANLGGGAGDVWQSNDSNASSTAGNRNWTDQKAVQLGGGYSPIAVQAIGQQAGNEQAAFSKALSMQLYPSNHNHGGGGDVSQSNDSSADSTAGNQNGTAQLAWQSLSLPMMLRL